MINRCARVRILIAGLLNPKLIRARTVLWSRTQCASNIYAPPKILSGEERIRVHAKTPDDPNDTYVSEEFRNIHTVYDMFHKGYKESNNGPCLGTRNTSTGKYEWINYGEVWEGAQGIGAGIQELGYPAGQKTLVGISSKNRKEFTMTMLGTMAYSSILVPFYNHMTQDAVAYAIQQTEIPIFICDTEDRAKFIIDNKNQFPNLKHLIYIETPPKSIVITAKNAGLSLHSIADIKMAGTYKFKKTVKPSGEDTFVICWTSGTTGMPKGAAVRHSSVISALVGIAESIKPDSLGGKRTISYMPTGHIYEILTEVQSLGQGGQIGFFGGDPLKLMDDIKDIKPQVIPMVPRILNRLYQSLRSDILNHPVKKYFFKRGFEAKMKLLKKGIITKNTLWDKLLFKNVVDAFGGESQVIITSAAPISAEISLFFRCTTGCRMYDIYGQTEIGGITITSPYDYKGENVGSPTLGTMIKLVDVPEMQYNAKDDIGEICIKGPTTITSYFKNPKATEETIDENGWLHTGDIGKWMPDGPLAIVDRKKHLFKLSQGEFVSPERLENTYNGSNLISQILVEGLSDQSYPVAIVIPDSVNFKKWANHKKFNSDSIEQLCLNKEVRRLFLNHLRKIGLKGKLTSIEQIKNVYLHPSLLTIEEGHITPTLKMKRNVVKKYFLKTIEEMYKEGPLLTEDKAKI